MNKFNRTIAHIPLVAQEIDDTCIYCTITWIQQFLELGSKLDCNDLIEKGKGTKVAVKILKIAKRIGFIEDFETIKDLSKKNLITMMRKDPIMIGVDDYLGSGAHMMAGVEASEDGQSIKCINWFNKKKQEITYVPFKDITFSASILRAKKRMNFLDNIISKFKSLPQEAKIGGAILAALSALLITIPVTENKQPQQEFGSAGVVANYSSTISGSGISSTDTSVPVSSVTLYTDEVFTSSDLIFPVYLMVNPKGSTREIVECWGLTGTTWTGCNRGMSALGGNTTSTVSGANYAHSSGEAIIMSNSPFFYNRFVDTSTDQSISGEKTMADSLFSFGDGTGQLVWNGTNMGWSDDDGTNTFTFASGGSGITASSTKGITITDSKILVNASTTQGLAFDANGALYINASSTASDNGGFLNFNSNKIYWDYSALVAKNNTWTGTNTFSATTTFDANVSTTANNLQITTDPDSDNDGVRYLKVQTMVTQGEVTSTSGEAFSMGDALYVSSTDDKVYNTDTDFDVSTYNFVGIALEAATGADETIRYAKPGSVIKGLSGFTAGSEYYLSSTAGDISSTPHATRIAKIGYAISSTELRVIEPRYIRRGLQVITSSTTFAQTTGFYPTRIEVIAGSIQSEGGISIGDDSNRCVYMQGKSAAATGDVSASEAWKIYDANASQNENSGTVTSKTQTGFTFNAGTYVTQATIHWTAYSH